MFATMLWTVTDMWSLQNHISEYGEPFENCNFLGFCPKRLKSVTDGHWTHSLKAPFYMFWFSWSHYNHNLDETCHSLQDIPCTVQFWRRGVRQFWSKCYNFLRPKHTKRAKWYFCYFGTPYLPFSPRHPLHSAVLKEGGETAAEAVGDQIRHQASWLAHSPLFLCFCISVLRRFFASVAQQLWQFRRSDLPSNILTGPFSSISVLLYFCISVSLYFFASVYMFLCSSTARAIYEIRSDQTSRFFCIYLVLCFFFSLLLFFCIICFSVSQQQKQ